MTSSQPKGTHFWVMTVDRPGRERATATQTGTYTPRPGSTREDAYHTIYASVTGTDPLLRGALVLFFSLEPNQL